MYPVTDLDLDTESYLEHGTGLNLSRAKMEWYWRLYLDGADGLHPDASPLRAEDMSGVAPAVVMTAEHDPLRSEGDAYAARLAEAGVSVDAHGLRRDDPRVRPHARARRGGAPGARRGRRRPASALAAARLARRRHNGVLLDEARLHPAEERRAILGEQRADGLRGEGGLRRLDAVEPELADAVPRRLLRRPALHDAEAQAAQAR